ncbi:MAG: cyclic 2,3-diphosphoglycerate synthase [Nitrospirota bacterium]|jgi:predicted GTPase|nr:cyclic 2,3-diphosphoglycerate synthase [Nitrospirota bacterium]
MPVTTVLIMGAAGRDFHNFNVVFRDRPEYRVVAFTAAQIPNIAGRCYPPELAGSLYPEGIPIHPEGELESLIAIHKVDEVIFAYSDISHGDVMHQASRVLAAGADFSLLGGRRTMVPAKKPVVSVCAVRTGAGKSPATRKIASLLREEGLRVAVIRHPMPYGDLAKQAVQRFACLEDLRIADCTIEEMEEYEPHIREGHVVFAGVDYERILREAEREADVLLWDGGNNDVPFFVSDLEIVLVDPHRAGHERIYFPGEVNLLRADVLVLTKMDTASPEQVHEVRANIRQLNPKAVVLETAMPVTVDRPHLIKGKRVLVIEDGPTLTHGGMSFGAGVLAAKQQGASELVDPRPYAVGTIQQIFAQYPHIGNLLPAMGYGATQVRELEDTIDRVPCDVVLIATPVDLGRIISIKQPTCRVTYCLEEQGIPGFRDVLAGVISQARNG